MKTTAYKDHSIIHYSTFDLETHYQLLLIDIAVKQMHLCSSNNMTTLCESVMSSSSLQLLISRVLIGKCGSQPSALTSTTRGSLTSFTVCWTTSPMVSYMCLFCFFLWNDLSGWHFNSSCVVNQARNNSTLIVGWILTFFFFSCGFD